MSSDRHCCVSGCKESGDMHHVLHHFPNPESARERFNTWLYAIGGDILGLENVHIFKHRRICRRHFEDKYLCRNNRLSYNAIPTLNMQGPISLPKFTFGFKKPLKEIQNLIATPSTSTGKNISSTVPVSLPGPSTSALHDIQKELDADVQIHRKTKRTKMLTPTEIEIRKKIIAAKVKLSKYKNKVQRQKAEIFAAKKMATNKFFTTIEKCSSVAKLLFQIQWRENKKKSQGRRFTLDEKIAALSILKQSPKGYSFLRRIFILPATQTLSTLVHKSNVKAGINKNIFQQLKKKVDNMKLEEKLCILLLDEMSIKAGVFYSERKDTISGFVDDGLTKKPEFANHAQVFMIRGLIHNYKQPVAYTFSSGATKGPELAKQIKAVIGNLQEVGLIIVAFVCDQGTNNRQAISRLIEETRQAYLRRGEDPKEKNILINNKEIIPLYDPPHLLKGLRNNLINKNLKFTQKGVTKVAKWSHLELLFRENPTFEGIRLIPKLTENHIRPEKINKMKVKYASQIFSRTVGANIGYLADKGILPLQCKDTASLLLFLDEIFDSMNGSFKKNGNAKSLLKAVTQTSQHYKVWEEGIKIFKTMKFINSAGKEMSVPSINNWVWTLEASKTLIKNLYLNYRVNSVWMRHLNQDPLENFFGAIRSHGCRNNNPTCSHFESSFITLLINNLNSVHTRQKNCEIDYCQSLHALVIDDNYCEASSTHSVDLHTLLGIKCQPINEKNKDPRIMAPLVYISGYFLKKVKSKVFKNCKQCSNSLINKNELEYIKYREYTGRRWLYSPSHQLIQFISDCQHITNEILKQNSQQLYLSEIITTAIFTLVDLKFIECLEHKKKVIDYLTKILIKFTIYVYCKNINKILAGRIERYDEGDLNQFKAKHIYDKMLKRKK